MRLKAIILEESEDVITADLVDRAYDRLVTKVTNRTRKNVARVTLRFRLTEESTDKG